MLTTQWLAAEHVPIAPYLHVSPLAPCPQHGLNSYTVRLETAICDASPHPCAAAAPAVTVLGRWVAAEDKPQDMTRAVCVHAALVSAWTVAD